MDSTPTAEYAERMVPESAHARTFWEHVERYRFARRYVLGKRVLDVASGEGYGAAGLLRAGAASVVGVDASAEACAHARRRYGLDARPGDAAALPLPDRSVDVVVSFETIEHVDDPAAFVRECARVLAPDGLLIVSTPNRPVYRGGAPANPFHRVEFDEREFVDLLGPNFRSIRLFTQFPASAAWWSPRSLAAERSPWLRVRGYWRLASTLCPALRADLADGPRASADAAVLAADRWPSTPFNPYLVRPRSAWGRERPYYLIAVAHRTP